jgi:rod shape-determining protein MreC
MLFMGLSLIFMTLDHRFQQLQTLRASINLIISPLKYVVDLPLRIVADSSEALSSRSHLLSENERLSSENLTLQARLQQFEALKNENQRLRKLMQASERVADEVEIAEILSVDLDPYKQLIVLNKGSYEDVFVGQPLLDANGVMGQIVETSPLRSTAMLISDPSHALPVQVNRNGLRTVAIGTGSAQTLELRFIPTSADIEEGDIVSTSGLGGRFPADYPVARVSKIQRIPGEPFAYIEAEPLAYLDRSREVLLVLSRPEPEEQEQEQETVPSLAEETVDSEASPGNTEASEDNQAEEVSAGE